MKNPDNNDKSQVLAYSGDESHLLRELYLAYHALLNNLPRIVGVSASRLALMRLLAIELPRETGTMEIARRLKINAAAVTRLVEELEEQKWVQRRGNPKDGRRTSVSLTAQGRRAFRRIHERSHEFERSISERLERQDIEKTIKVLSEIRNALEYAK